MAIFQQGAFTLDPKDTPDSIRKKRAMIQQLIMPYGKASNIGEGVAQLFNGIGTGMQNRKLDKIESAGQASGATARENIMSAMMGGNSAPIGQGPFPDAPSAPKQANYEPSSPSKDTAPSAMMGGDTSGFVSYANQGAIRNRPVADTLSANLADAVRNVYGDGYKAQIYSGGQDGKGEGSRRTGSVRHDHGKAGDVYIIGPDGKKISGDALAPLGQYWAAKKYGGVGMEMHGGGIHLDEWVTPPAGGGMHWNYAKQGGQYTPAMQAAMAQGLKGQLPTLSGYQAPQETQVASLDSTIGMNSMVPTPQPRPEAQAGNAMAQQAPQPQQIAQAAPQAPQGQIMDAGTPFERQGQSQGMDLNMLMQQAQNPWLDDNTRQMVNGLIQQEMQKQDPAYQMQQQQAQIGLQKSQLELQQMQNPTPEYDTITGKDGSIFRVNKAGGPMETLYGPQPDVPKPTADIQEYEYAKGQGFQGSFQDFQIAVKRAGASQVNIDQKAEGAFDKKLAEGQAEAFNTMAQEGLNARADLAIIGELDGLLKGSGGTLSGLSGIAAKYGIGGEGVSDIQAAQALINKLVPTQRQAGSGSMSDRDVELFTRSLPSLWNSPGGNEKIINVMRGLAAYKQAQGEIADQILMGEMSRQEGRKALRAIPNPIADFNKSDTPTAQPQPSPKSPNQVPQGIDPAVWEFMSPEGRALWN